ncbi:MAG TPA: TonB-dependent receptor [Stellaceae bacterium]|nr:TonB-dependent receptor [Stellaceae bacterium]
MRWFSLSAALGAAVMTAIPALAADLSGRVLDAAGKPAAKASVTLQAQDGKQVAETTTDATGAYRLTGIPAGDYSVLGASDEAGRDGVPVTIGATAVEADLHLVPTEIQEITITARHLTAARTGIQTQTGASTYSIGGAAIEAQPGGANTPLNQVMLQAPGVAQDSFGQLHIRGEHNNLQYRLNGIILPEGISVFGQTLNPRLADKVELITGALPAEYGLRTAGIIDITTKTGMFENGGEVGIYGGSHGTLQQNAEYGGSAGGINYFVSGSYLQSGLGIESPDGRSDPLHDRTDQGQGFAYFEDILDTHSKLSLIFGTSREQFQIPNKSGAQPQLGLTVNGQTTFPSEQLNENQRELTHYGVASYLYSSDRFDVQVSGFGRYSSLYFTPDATGDLLYNGIAQTAYKRDIAGGVQTEGTYRLNVAHTLRAGIVVQADRGTSTTSSLVLPTDQTGAQTSDQPITIGDTSAKTAWQYSVYLQDEWKLTPTLIVNYGGRFDLVDGYDHESQASPRINVIWQPTDTTTIHGGYARYFTPPPFELVGSATVSKFANTTAASTVTTNTTPRAEKAHYFDLGVSQKVIPGLTIGLDTYYKLSRNLIDEGQFGAPIVLTPFNYASGKQYGAELSASYRDGPFSAYGNFAWSVAEGKGISSSQFNFSAEDLAYIAQHYIHLDHDQTYTASAGASYLWHQTRFSTDLVFGSGLRSSTDHPNSGSLPDYVTVNLGVAQSLDLPYAGKLKLRFDVINVFDEIYEIRNGSGVGVGAPQYGARRGFFGGVSKVF